MTLPLWAEGPVEPARPRPIRIRATRGIWLFESKPAALAWAARNAPITRAGVRALSAHPRAVKLGEQWCLVYDAAMQTPVKLVLGKGGHLLDRR